MIHISEALFRLEWNCTVDCLLQLNIKKFRGRTKSWQDGYGDSANAETPKCSHDEKLTTLLLATSLVDRMCGTRSVHRNDS
jgi:hypothetical protein